MKFELAPILDEIEALYQIPRTRERFDAYLFMLQGAKKGEMILPISGYNPMAKEEVLQQISHLKALKAEHIIENVLAEINPTLKKYEKDTFQVVLNLADDIGGAWSNFYTTDYTTKFDINALVKRRFCTPYLWTSEKHTAALVAQRTREYVYRTIFWVINDRPKSLKNFVEQEVFVQIPDNGRSQEVVNEPYISTKKYYLENLNSEEYSLIFNFFYGDEASQALGYPTYGRAKYEGFSFAKHVALKLRKC